MNRRPIGYRLALLACLVLGAFAFSCGGGGGDGGGDGGGGVTPGLVPTFTPASPTPVARTINMSAGTSTGDAFQVRFNVTGINDFLGAAFQVLFDPAVVQFVSPSGSGSFLGVANTDFRAEVQSPGVLIVDATRLGGAGVDVAGTSLLITINFRAIDESAGTAFTFGPAATREVQTCATANTCVIETDGTLTWSGGTLVVVLN